jgi:hypothetical protein
MKVVANSSVTVTGLVFVPNNTDLSKIIIDWRLEDEAGAVFAASNSTNFAFTSVTTARGIRISVSDTFVVPNNLPLSISTQYFVVWTVSADTGEYTYTQQLEVEAAQVHLLMAEDLVSLSGPVTLFATLPVGVGANVTILQGNNTVYSGAATLGAPNSVGYEWSIALDTSAEGILPLLDPLTVLWNFVEGTRPQQMMASLYIITPVQLKAAEELRQFLNRVHQEARLPELDYTIEDMVRWLKMGMDKFNALGLYTQFTMTNAQSAIYHWWMTCSIVIALRNQYLVEGNRSFQFQGQQVTLDVDITQYLQSMADTLQGQIDNEMLRFKQQLKNYGLSGGDGSMGGKFQVGAVGLSMNPASNLGYSGMGYRTWIRVR